jgi:uncharacterized protein (TIGR00266 family)
MDSIAQPGRAHRLDYPAAALTGYNHENAMNITIENRPAHSVAVVQLDVGEHIRAEAGAMLSYTPNIQVTTEGPSSRGAGGLLKNLKRAMLSGETFFTNLYTAVQAPGQLTFAPNLCGDMVVHDLAPPEELFIQGSSYVAAPDSVQIDTRFQGFWRGALGGENFFFLHATGAGPVVINAFGGISCMDLHSQEIVVDTGHLVAFTSGIDYAIDKAARGLIASWLSGEGFVLRLRGTGRVYVQTRNPNDFGSHVGARLPPREN